ncbi:hypothetical protein [Pseudomonas amygdali]|uniref:hypothetical protein n=1 Tax=Pseudomonas amygdali TaxID=47877 RepID=UPI001FB6BC41|nr:hypothetical protein [Pseudomonas amygdali]UPT37292.1 hypothetical protein LT107_00895 [Pseudomonas amygdali pv. loropetali]
MDVKALRVAAITLREKLEIYKRCDPDASILLLQLEGLLSRAEQGQITELVEPRDIPGYKLFTETRLQFEDMDYELARAIMDVSYIAPQSANGLKVKLPTGILYQEPPVR